MFNDFNFKYYWEVLGLILIGEEIYVLCNLGDFNCILFINCYFDNEDVVSYIDVKDFSKMLLGIVYVLFSVDGLILGGINNSFDVNNVSDVIVILVDIFKSVFGYFYFEYMLVVGYNCYQQGIFLFDFDYVFILLGSG